MKDIEKIISCYIPNFKFKNYQKTKEERSKMTDNEKRKYFDDLIIIKNCLDMIKINNKLGLI